jgi:heme-degrading monooxygenase HmoA
MVLQIVRFRSGLPDEEVRDNYLERSSRYREVKGLLQKYYLRYPETGEHGAVYVWVSEEALKDFRASDLGRSIADTYKIEGEKVVENAEVLLTLRP